MARLKVAIGVDAGGTYTKVAAVTAEGKIVEEAQLPAQVLAGPQQFSSRVCSLIESWIKTFRFDILGVGMGIAGDVDSDRGMLRFTPNLKGWDGFDFRQELRERLKRPVVVENDANAAVWGGFVMDLKKKPRNVVGVTLGTGVGGGLVLDGRLYRGATGSAGEIGHTIVEPGGAPCHCGGRGCLEAYAGSYGIVRLAREIIAQEPSRAKALAALCPDLKQLEPRHLSVAADQGDEASRETWKRVGGYLARGLANLVLVLNPDVILILGGVSRAGRWLMDPIEKNFQSQSFRTPFSRVKIKLADNTKAGCIGAAKLSLERSH